PSSLFLMLCGDIESNPGPSTDELIMELGRSLGTRLDNLSTDLQSLRTTITSMSCQISELTKQLQKKEEDIEDVKSRTKGLEGRLEKNGGGSRATANNQKTRQHCLLWNPREGGQGE
ncbi:hypothetical protein, partial [Thiolapillus sp.]|uniref:hypothetical protein n=1 Tax=Thiolapillus sp. TaxID=2017437 RepID=UPI003AF49D91